MTAPATEPLGGLSFFVPGTPAAQGSKRHLGNGVMVESSKRVKPWREDIRQTALDQLANRPGFGRGMPLRVALAFTFPRPQAHYRTGRHAHQLRDGAPQHVVRAPDLDKLCRAVLDALTSAGVWHDDAQVSTLRASKSYTDATPGVTVSISALDVTP